MTTCPKCKYTSGNDWSQCGGSCPMDSHPSNVIMQKAPQTLKRLKDAVESYRRRGYLEYSAHCQDAVDLIETLLRQKQ